MRCGATARAIRSYTYVDDMVDGIYLLMHSDLEGAANIGCPQYVSVDELVATVAEVAGKTDPRQAHRRPGGRAVAQLQQRAHLSLGWQPQFDLKAGIARTYPWIEAQVRQAAQRQITVLQPSGEPGIWIEKPPMAKKVLVSGCFDLLHSGHVAFFQEAAPTAICTWRSARTRRCSSLKGRVPVNAEEERLFMVKAVVRKDAFISRGSGMLDFWRVQGAAGLLRGQRGRQHARQAGAVRGLGIEYVVLRASRTPAWRRARRPRCARSPDALSHRPGRGLAGPAVRFGYYPGPVHHDLARADHRVQRAQRHGHQHAQAAIALWGRGCRPAIPRSWRGSCSATTTRRARKEISGSQDAIGLVFPGLATKPLRRRVLARAIERDVDEERLQFVESASTWCRWARASRVPPC